MIEAQLGIACGEMKSGLSLADKPQSSLATLQTDAQEQDRVCAALDTP